MVPIKTRLANRANYGGKRSARIEWIVMHYTANDGDSDDSNANYFQQNLRVQDKLASAHYFVDDDSITRTVPDEYIAYHCGAYTYRHKFCRNTNSIGIEMCDSKKDGRVMATDKTIHNAAELAGLLAKQYGIPIDHIIMHYDVTGKLCPAYWVGNDGLAKFRARVKAIMDGEEDEDMATRYKTINDVPQSLRKETQELIDAGALKGKGADGLDVTEDMLRCMIITKRYVDTVSEQK